MSIKKKGYFWDPIWIREDASSDADMKVLSTVLCDDDVTRAKLFSLGGHHTRGFQVPSFQTPILWGLRLSRTTMTDHKVSSMYDVHLWLVQHGKFCDFRSRPDHDL